MTSRRHALLHRLVRCLWLPNRLLPILRSICYKIGVKCVCKCLNAFCTVIVVTIYCRFLAIFEGVATNIAVWLWKAYKKAFIIQCGRTWDTGAVLFDKSGLLPKNVCHTHFIIIAKYPQSKVEGHLKGR